MRILILLAGLALPLSAQSQVLIVDDDPTPGAVFTTIQQAVDQAQPGDLVLVRDGAYPQFTVSGKGLDIVADGLDVRVVPTPAGFPETTTTTLEGVPVGERVFLRGLTFATLPGATLGNTLEVDSCEGLVWIEDVVVDPDEELPLAVLIDQFAGVRVTDSPSVLITRSVIEGANNGTLVGSGLGARGLRLTNSTAFVHSSTISAGATPTAAGLGAPGVEMFGGTAVLRDSTIVGGTGGPSFQSGAGGTGGPGLFGTNSPEAWSIGTEFFGGAGGPFTVFGGRTGTPGDPIGTFAGPLVEESATAVLLTTTPVVRDDPDSQAFVDVASAPGSTVFLLVDLAPAPEFLPAFPDVAGVGLNPIILTAGTTDASGLFSLASGSPSLPPGLPTYSIGIQAALITPSTALELSNPSIITFVDDAL